MSHPHPIFWILIAAVLAPLIAAVPTRLRLPAVIIEVVLGVAMGPEGLGLVAFDGFIASMYPLAMAVTLFMAGMELDFAQIRGRPLKLAAMGWAASLVLGVAAIGLLHVVPQAQAPLMVTIALSTTGLGVLMPILRDGGHLVSPFGRLVAAIGTFGELGPIVAMSVLLSQEYRSWQEVGFLAAFIGVVGISIAVGVAAHPPAILQFLQRQMRTSTQLPVRIALLILAGLFVLAEEFGFEAALGAFAAGTIVGQTTKSAGAEPVREKIDAVAFAWFYPFFFVGMGVKFDIAGLLTDLTIALMVPAFALLFLLIRGTPVWFFYRKDLEPRQLRPLALLSAVPSLSIVIVVTEIGLKTKAMSSGVASALIGAALLALLLFLTLGSAALQRTAKPSPKISDVQAT